jgi:hypothetical protein
LLFCPGQPDPWFFCFKLLTITGMIDKYMLLYTVIVWNGHSQTFCQGWTQTTVLCISASYVDKNTGVLESPLPIFFTKLYKPKQVSLTTWILIWMI